MADSFLKQALRPLEENFGALLGGHRDTSVTPTETVGAPATPIFGGYVVENEKDPDLTDRQRYRTFSEALANVSIVAAGVRYFLNLAGGATWSFEPAEHPRGEELADEIKTMLTEDPDTTWPRIVRRAAMYRFYGFSVQEWIMRRRDDGQFTLADVAPRAQITIERWDVDTGGNVLGVVQRNPQNQKEIYLPRGKIMYIVDDTLNDSPQGLGLFRHIIASVRRLQRYEQLEGFGFEGDLRGIPVGKVPFSEINAKIASGELTRAKAAAMIAPVESFIKKHVKRPDLGVIMDSEPFATIDEAARPSPVPKFDVSLLEGSSEGLEEVSKAIERLNREIARILGIEAILLGDGDRGSHALAREKTSQFSLTVDATLEELADSVRKDIITPLFEVNGWPLEAMPKAKVEAVQYMDIEAITEAIRDLAQAGAMIDPEDPVVAEIYTLLGLTAEPGTGLKDDGTLTGEEDDDEPPAPGDSPPDDPLEDGETMPEDDE